MIFKLSFVICSHMTLVYIRVRVFLVPELRSCAVGLTWQFRPTNGCNIITEETLNGGKNDTLCPNQAAENRTDVTPDTRSRLSASFRMSVSAPKGLASSGQKPIAEIIHPLSAAEEPLSITVNIGGDKVESSDFGVLITTRECKEDWT